jgi:hypothetical protein
MIGRDHAEANGRQCFGWNGARQDGVAEPNQVGGFYGEILLEVGHMVAVRIEADSFCHSGQIG